MWAPFLSDWRRQQAPQSAGGMQAAQPSADSPSADSSSRLEDWAPDALQAGEDIQTAVRRVEAAAREADLAGAKAACQQMSDANQRLKAMLPSPVPAVTSEVRGVVDEVGAASSLCWPPVLRLGSKTLDYSSYT